MSTELARRKHGVVSLFRPVTWNKGRRFTSPGPPDTQTNTTKTNNYQEGPLLRMQIEAYLDDNPEFAESYVLRKVGRKTIEKWLHQHSVTEQDDVESYGNVPKVVIEDQKTPVRKISDNVIGKYRTSYTNKIKSHFSADSTPSLKKRSHSVTPGRKISASAFEASGLRSPILTTDQDGCPSFLASTVSLDPGFNRQRSRSAIINSGDLPERRSSLADMTVSLAADMDIDSLSDKLARNMLNFCPAPSCSIAVPRTDQYDEFEILQTCVRQSGDIGEIPLPPEKASFKLGENTISKLRVGETCEVTRLENLPESEGGYTVIPLKDPHCPVIQGLAIIPGFSNYHSSQAMQELSRIAGVCLKNSAQFNSVQLEVTRSQVFLDLARVIFDQQTSLDFTVLKILVNFLLLIECERAQVMLSNKGSPTKFNKVYDLEESDLVHDEFHDLRSPFQTRAPISGSISGLVAATKETVNIADVVNDERFDWSIEGGTTNHQRSLLCMPLLDCDKETLGVVLLVNKRAGKFSENDERFVEAFAVFCGIAIKNVSQYEQAREAEARSQVALDIMTYHAVSDPKEAEELAKLPVPSALSYNLASLQFSDTLLEERDTLRACLRMFYELDLVSRFDLNHQTLCRWLLTVKKNYRSEVLYHNWDHAFNVAQMMFTILLNSGWWEQLGPVCCLSLLISCLSHDLDHRGTNNSFQLATDSPLAKLYSTSTLERHHLNQALIILNLEDNRILDNLTPVEYSETMELMEECILATDLALHFANMTKYKALGEEVSRAGHHGLKWECGETRRHLRSILMTASDLGGSTKPWDVQKEVAGLIAEEFWIQGDIEKVKLSGPSNNLMDRGQRHNFPQLQAGFCEGVCLPVYRILAQLSPQLELLQEGVTSNADKWRNFDMREMQDEEEAREYTTDEDTSSNSGSEDKASEEAEHVSSEAVKTVRNL